MASYGCCASSHLADDTGCHRREQASAKGLRPLGCGPVSTILVFGLWVHDLDQHQRGTMLLAQQTVEVLGRDVAENTCPPDSTPSLAVICARRVERARARLACREVAQLPGNLCSGSA